MKTKILSIIATITLIVGLTGCASTSGQSGLSPKTKSRIQSGVKLAAYVGTVETLRAYPQYRAGFELAARELKVLETGEVDTIKLLEIVNRLPVKELKSDRAQMIITSATILLADELGATPLEKLEDLKPVIASIREGVERGLGAQ